MGLTNKTKDMILKNITGRTSSISIATTCYMGIGTIVDDVFTEPTSDSGYARTLIGTYNSAATYVMGDSSEGTTTNTRMISFTEALKSWGTVTHFALFSSLESTEPVMIGELSEPVEVPVECVPIFRAGKFSITIN